MKVVQRLFVCVIWALSILTCLMACGGGGGSSETESPIVTPPAYTATVTGTVAGTTVVAYNASTGIEVTRCVAVGTPKAFSLTLPVGVSYKIYLLENEGTENQRVYPLYQGNTNVFDIGGSADITVDLGYVDTSSGKAVPENNPLEIAGVASGGAEATVPTDIATSAYTLADLSGAWNFHNFFCGAYAAWSYGSANIDSSGNATFDNPVATSSGEQTSEDVLFSITPAGVTSFPEHPEMNFHGMLSTDKSLMVNTRYLDTGVYSLSLWQKKNAETTFALTDLAGTWTYHGLVASMSSDASVGAWYYGTASIDDDGGVTYVTGTSNEGTSSPPSGISHYYAITADGAVTFPEYPGYFFHGVMSSDKSLIVITRLGHSLVVWQKGGGTFLESDMQGTWKFKGLVAGTGSVWQGWVYGRATINGTSMTLSNIKANGVDQENISKTLSVTAEGVATSGTLHAQMSNDKKMIVGTMTTEGEGYMLMILQR